MKKVGLKILPRPEVLDAEGRAVQKKLCDLGIETSSVEMGRYIVLHIPETQDVLMTAKNAAESLLCNSLIENYELVVLEEERGS